MSSRARSPRRRGAGGRGRGRVLAALPKSMPHGLTVRGEEAPLLVTLEPARAEYLFMPRDDSDADPAKFDLIIQGFRPGNLTRLAGLRRRSRDGAATAVDLREAEAKLRWG